MQTPTQAAYMRGVHDFKLRQKPYVPLGYTDAERRAYWKGYKANA